MPIRVVPVAGRHDLTAFVRLPARLHRNDHGWVPPLLMDERRAFDPKRNLALAYCDHALWLAYDGPHLVGRVAGIINRRYNTLRGERTGRFSHFESAADEAVARTLLTQVEDWSRAAGMERIVGPMGFTDQDPEGFLVEGFEEEASIATCQNAPWLIPFLESLGWTKEVDYVVYHVSVPAATPPFYERIAHRVERQGVLRVVEFERRRELNRFIGPILELMNETFTDLAGYSPLDRREMDDLARRYRPVIDPRFVKVVRAGDVPVGFIIAIPNLNRGFRRAHGRLLPLGWLWILRAARRATRLDLLLGGIKDGYRGRGVDVLLGNAMINSARRAGFPWMDSHHELESNTQVRGEMERMGGRLYKRFRIFQKRI